MMGQMTKFRGFCLIRIIIYLATFCLFKQYDQTCPSCSQKSGPTIIGKEFLVEVKQETTQGIGKKDSFSVLKCLDQGATVGKGSEFYTMKGIIISYIQPHIIFFQP